MAISIRNPRAEKLARELAKKTDTSMTDAIIDALEQKLRQLSEQPIQNVKLLDILNISKRCAALPTLDRRSEEKILGYDSQGVPER